MGCVFKKNKKCLLFSKYNIRFNADNFCGKRCDGTPGVQNKLLTGFGVKLNKIPDSIEELESGEIIATYDAVPEPASKKLTKRLPSNAQMVKNLLSTATDTLVKLGKDTKKAGIIQALKHVGCCDEQIALRKTVCDACDHREDYKNHERCMSFPGKEGCGCYLEQKRKLAASECEHWEDIDKQFTI